MNRLFLQLAIISLAFLFFLPQSSYAATEVPVSDGFDFPLGAPDGGGYGVGCCGGLDYLERYDYERDGNPEHHPGEDWNSDSGSDAGDPVHAVSNGLIKFAAHGGTSWGYVVLIEHKLKNGTTYWSQYAHLDKLSGPAKSGVGQTVKRGDIIGNVGDFPDGYFIGYHLHFELRKKYQDATRFVLDWPQSKVEEYYVNPSEFIKANRPLPPPTPQKLSITPTGTNGAEVSWDEATGKDLDRYELYRSEASGEKGEKIFSSAEKSTLKYTDTSLYAEQDYYYRLFTYYKNGQVAESNEVTIRFKRESINVSNAPGVQRYVGISKNKVYWENNYRDQTNFPNRKNLYYYDLESKTTSSMPIGSVTDRIDGPYKPSIGGDWLCYYGKRSTYGNYEIFCRNLASDMPVDIQITSFGGDDVDPQVSEEGIVAWQGVSGTEKRIFWTNLNSGVQIYPVLESGYQTQPRIWGKNIIWKHKTAISQASNLMIKNIETGAEATPATDIDDGAIDIWDGYIIYSKNDKILLAKIADADSARVIVENGQNARMRDGKIVYSKVGSDSKYFVYVYIIATGKTINVAGPIKYQPSPVIYENMVAYNASPNDTSTDMDIYLTWL